MKIKYLGTAAAEGFPGLFCRCENCVKARKLGGKNMRTRSQALIGDKLLVDFPPDSYYHTIAHGIPFSEIDHVIITHSHSDHFYPEDLLLRVEPFCLDVATPVTVYGNDEVVKRVRQTVKSLTWADADKMLKAVHLEAFKTYEIAGYQVTPLLANHDKSENCFIYIINDGQKTMLYGNDTGIFTEAAWDAIKGRYFDIVSLDCTFMLRAEGTNHMGLPDNIEVKNRLISMGAANDKTIFIVNHFSHNLGCLHEEMVEQASAAGFLVSYDGYTLDTEGESK